MALTPTRRATPTTASSSTNGTTVTVTLPAGLQDGDRVYVTIENRASSGGDPGPPTSSPDGSWVLLGNQGSSSNNFNVAVYRRTLGAGEGATHSGASKSWGLAGSRGWAVTADPWKDIDATAGELVAFEPFQDTTAGSDHIVRATGDPVAPDTQHVMLGASGCIAPTSRTPLPSPWAGLVEAVSSGGTVASLSIGYRAAPTSTLTADSWTCSGSHVSVGAYVLLTPASGKTSAPHAGHVAFGGKGEARSNDLGRRAPHAGQVAFGGTADARYPVPSNGAGNVTFGGHAQPRVRRRIAGHVAFGGTAAPHAGAPASGAGHVAFGGTASPRVGAAYVRAPQAGHVAFGGTATGHIGTPASGAGHVAFGGTADARVREGGGTPPDDAWIVHRSARTRERVAATARTRVTIETTARTRVTVRAN